MCTNPHAAEGPNEDKERGDPELAAFMKKVGGVHPTAACTS